MSEDPSLHLYILKNKEFFTGIYVSMKNHNVQDVPGRSNAQKVLCSVKSF